MKQLDCYANSLNECEGPITEEHIISHSLLCDSMIVNILDIEKSFAKSKFVVNNLCMKHNRFFSRSESHIKQIYTSIANISADWKLIHNMSKNDHYKTKIIHVKGDYLEKWLIKTAINYSYLINDFRKPDIDFNYLSPRLFKNKSFERPYGLSLLMAQEQTTHKYPGAIFFQPLLDENRNICGTCINLQGYLFLVLFYTSTTYGLTRGKIDFEGFEFDFDKNINWHGQGFDEIVTTADGHNVIRSSIRIRW